MFHFKLIILFNIYYNYYSFFIYVHFSIVLSHLSIILYELYNYYIYLNIPIITNNYFFNSVFSIDNSSIIYDCYNSYLSIY